MKSRFFDKNKSELQFEWNAAKRFDWPIIRRNFVAAYISSYINRSFEELQYDDALKQQAEKIWDEAYSKGYDQINNEIIHPLKFYLSYQNKPLEQECIELQKHFEDKSRDISLIKEMMIKLILLQYYFENDFDDEENKIHSHGKKLDYLIARFHDRPFAFFVCEYNYKSAHVYLRFVTMSPSFHRLGLGEKILEEIVKRYPDATGMELYTRKANHGAQVFYKHCGLIEYQQFDFDKPVIELGPRKKLSLPNDDATSHPEAFVAFSKLTHVYKG